jgi:hypothetical protein
VSEKRVRRAANAERPPAVDNQHAGEPLSDLGKIARLLALLLVRGRPLIEQAGTLAAAGFGHAEIAGLVGSTPASVKQSVYMWRKSRPSPKPNGRDASRT